MSAKRFSAPECTVYVDDDYPPALPSAVTLLISERGKLMTASEAYDLGRALVFAALEARRHQAGDHEWQDVSTEIRNPFLRHGAACMCGCQCKDGGCGCGCRIGDRA